MGNKRNRNLPEDLEHEILLRLPVNALLPCKCVCKKWCALIKSPSFIKRHFNHESNHDCLLIQLDGPDDDCEYQYAIYKDEENASHSRFKSSPLVVLLPFDHSVIKQLFGPVHGIFCVVSDVKGLGLLNPATRELKILPPYPFHDPCRVSPVIGFGLDRSTGDGDFKVVVFEKSEPSFAFVYNLSRNSWRRIETGGVLELVVFGHPETKNRIVNGVNHWLVKYANTDVSTILAFDIMSEKFQLIPLPDALANTERFLGFTIAGDSIAVMSFKFNENVDLWVMGRDGVWSKSFCIQLQDSAWPWCVWKKKKVFYGELLSPLVMRDVSSQKVTTLMLGMGSDYLDPHVFDHFIYKESLVSIKGRRVRRVEDLF